MAARVRLEAFSGLQDPQWVLTEEEEDRVAATIRDLPDAGPVRPRPAHLGYRGCVIEGLASHDEVVVYRATVWIGAGVEVRMRSDPDRGLERYLLEISRGRLAPHFASIVEKVERGEL